MNLTVRRFADASMATKVEPAIPQSAAHRLRRSSFCYNSIRHDHVPRVEALESLLCVSTLRPRTSIRESFAIIGRKTQL